jgi:hypothetical protein
MKYILGFFFLFVNSEVAFAASESPFVNLEQYLTLLRYDRCEEFLSARQPSIAILENSFPDINDEIGKTLPEDIELLNPELNRDSEAKHGLYVAQLVYLLTTRGGRCPELAPKIYLIPAMGFKNFNAAIQTAIDLGVDFILNNNVYEYHGFSDGKGFLNNSVNRAIDAGIIWINAAGNFQTKVFQNKVQIQEDGWLTFSTSENVIRITCPQTKHNEDCETKLTLQWNDFRENTTDATTQDLDLMLTDDAGRPVESSSRMQTDDEELLKEDPDFNTRYPYESIRVKLKPGNYFVKIKAQSDNFYDDSEFRLIVNSAFTQLVSRSENAITVFPPADNPRVITVGANDSELSSKNTFDAIQKPEFRTASALIREEGEYRGSSISASIFAALATLIKMRFPDADQNEINRRIDSRFLEVSQCKYEALLTNDDDLNTVAENFPSTVIYPHKDGLRLLTPYDPYSFFGVPSSPNAFLGLGPGGDVIQVNRHSYHHFISLHGTIIDEQRNYSICK